jgi:hypothetical protein
MEIQLVGGSNKTKPIYPPGIKAKRRPSAENPKREYRNPERKRLTEAGLKKQTQFVEAKINVKLLLPRDYRNNDAFAVRKNKPNSNPISESHTCPQQRKEVPFGHPQFSA